MARLSGRLWHLLFNLLALALLLTALLVSLGRALLPLVADYRQDLERVLGQQLGQPVLVGRLEARWPGLVPQLLIEDVQVGGPEGAIHLDRLRLVPALLASLQAGAPRLASVELEGLRLALHEQADGRWRLKGLGGGAEAAAPEASAATLRLPARLDWLQQVVLFDSRLTLEQADGQTHSLSYIAMNLRRDSDDWRLDGRLHLPDGQPLAWQLRMASESDGRLTQAALYLDLPQTEWAQWLAGRLPAGWQMAYLRGGGQLWLDWHPGSLQLATRLHLPQVAAQAQALAAPLQLQEVDLSAWLQLQDGSWELVVDGLGADLAGVRIAPGMLRIHHQADEPQWRVRATRLDLGRLAAVLRQMAPFPPAAQEVIDTLAFHGVVHDLRATVQPRAGHLPEVHYQMQLEQLGFSAWHGVPASENISGSLSGTLEGGELRLDGRDFMLHLAQFFPEPWRYREAHARLFWSLRNGAFTLGSHLMRLSGDEGELAGNMLIRLYLDGVRESYMDLQVGLKNGQARYTGRYLPSKVPDFSPSLDGWLRTAIGDGQIDEGMFVYQGSLQKGASPAAHAMALYFGLRNTSLDYQSGWPALSGIDGQVFVEDSAIRVLAQRARALDANLSQVQAEVLRNGSPPQLKITGHVDGSMADGLHILQDTPLGQTGLFTDWQGEGGLQSDLQLTIPLAAAAPPLRAIVDLQPQGVRLSLPHPVLELTELTGRFRYDTSTGLSASEIRGQAFGEWLRGSATATGRPGAPRTRLDLSGSVQSARLLKWLGVEPSRLPLSGRLPYQLRLELGSTGSNLQVSSDLRGIRVDLPAPFGKAADELRATQWSMPLNVNDPLYALRYGDLAQLLWLAPGGRVLDGRGELLLGAGQPQLPAQAGLRLRGQLGLLDWAGWQQWLGSHAAQTSGAPRNFLLGGELQVDRLQAGSLQLADLQLDLQPHEGGWQLQLQNPQLSGVVAIPRDGPLDVQLRELRLPAASGDGARQDVLATLDPRSLPAMDVAIDALWLGERRLGRWNFSARPQADGLHFEPIMLGLAGMRAEGVLDWQSERTHFQGRLHGENLAAVLQNWGFEPSLTSKEFRLELDGSWKGSPAMVGLRDYTGSLQMRARDGQVLEGAGGASALRVFGLLNFDAISRRLRLDFSDLVGRGLAYDRIDGRLDGVGGIFLTGEPLVLDGPSTRLELNGQLDMISDRIAARLRVTLPISNNLPLAALLAGAAPVAGALLIVDRLVGDHLSKVASVTYQVDGPWQDPQISPWRSAPNASDSSPASTSGEENP